MSPDIVPACSRDDGSFQADSSLLPVSLGDSLRTTTDTCRYTRTTGHDTDGLLATTKFRTDPKKHDRYPAVAVSRTYFPLFAFRFHFLSLSSMNTPRENQSTGRHKYCVPALLY